MRKISDTIARLAALKAIHVPGAASGDGPAGRLSPMPAFGSNPGALSARYYLPKDFAGGSPLVVVLHGCTQTAGGYDHHSGWSQLADEVGIALLYPEQQRGNNPNLCFNWFLSGDTQRDAGEALSIRQMIDAMVATHGLDSDQIFITGLSAGGAMAAAMLAAYPEVFAGGAVIAGLAHGSATTVPEAFDRMRAQGLPSDRDLQRAVRDASDHQGPWPRISIWHGAADQTVASANARSIAAQWRAVHELDKAPTYSWATGVHSREVWCDANGDAMIEINMIAGMGHGTPLASGLGRPGPFMLDVGVSSTREIAGFWGIATVDAMRPSARPDFELSEPPTVPSESDALVKRFDPQPRATPAPQHRIETASGVQKTIEDALRAAGLMR